MIKSIPLNKLVPSPGNVRRHPDAAAADAELKASRARSPLETRSAPLREGPPLIFAICPLTLVRERTAGFDRANLAAARP